MLRKILWGPTLFTAVAVVAWTASVGQDAAQEAILPTVLVASILWYGLVARKSHPGIRRGILAGALTGLASQVVVTLVRRSGSHAVVGSWSMLLGAATGWLAVMIQRILDDAASGERE